MSTLLVYEKTLSRGKKCTGGERIFRSCKSQSRKPRDKKNGLYLGLCLKPSKELLTHKFTARVCGVSQH